MKLFLLGSLLLLAASYNAFEYRPGAFKNGKGAVVFPLSLHNEKANEFEEFEVEEDLNTKGASLWNDGIDRILALLATKLKESGGDPLPLPDFKKGFNVTDLIGIEWQGEIGLKDGSMAGLSTIYRVGNATKTNGMVWNITLTAGFDNLDLKYGFVAEFMNLGPQGTVDAVIRTTRADVEMQVKVIGLTAQLFSLNLKLGHIDVEIKGLGVILGFLSGTLSEWVVNLIRGPITNIAERVLTKAIGDLLANIDIGSIINGSH